MKVVPTALPEVMVVEPHVFGDERGFFFEAWNQRALAAAGIEARFVQENHSRSAAGVLRGLHYQIRQPQGKLLRVVAGALFDVAVDLRRSSPRFGQWAGVTLTAGSRRMIWVPPGFAHGFLALADGTEAVYACTDFHAPEHERSLLWSDPALGIAWPLTGEPIVSARDAAAPPLAHADCYP